MGTMRVVVLVVAAWGCSYHPRALDSDAPATSGDAASGVDAARPAIDATPPAIDATVTACALETDDGQLDTTGQAGGGGGGSNPGMSIQCDRPADVIVGISLAMSDAVIFYGGRSALSMDITCAPVTVRSNGTATVGATYTHEMTGNGAQDWSPATSTAVAMCPADAVVTGLDVHTGASGHLLQNVTITCAQIGADGAPTGTVTPVYVAGSLTDTNGDDAVTCGAGRVLRRLEPWTGSGLDSVVVRCAPVRCAAL